MDLYVPVDKQRKIFIEYISEKLSSITGFTEVSSENEDIPFETERFIAVTSDESTFDFSKFYDHFSNNVSAVLTPLIYRENFTDTSVVAFEFRPNDSSADRCKLHHTTSEEPSDDIPYLIESINEICSTNTEYFTVLSQTKKYLKVQIHRDLYKSNYSLNGLEDLLDCYLTIESFEKAPVENCLHITFRYNELYFTKRIASHTSPFVLLECPDCGTESVVVESQATQYRCTNCNRIFEDLPLINGYGPIANGLKTFKHEWYSADSSTISGVSHSTFYNDSHCRNISVPNTDLYLLLPSDSDKDMTLYDSVSSPELLVEMQPNVYLRYLLTDSQFSSNASVDKSLQDSIGVRCYLCGTNQMRTLHRVGAAVKSDSIINFNTVTVCDSCLAEAETTVQDILSQKDTQSKIVSKTI